MNILRSQSELDALGFTIIDDHAFNAADLSRGRRGIPLRGIVYRRSRQAPHGDTFAPLTTAREIGSAARAIGPGAGPHPSRS